MSFIKTLSPLALSTIIFGCADPDRIPNPSMNFPDAGRLDFDVPGVDVPYDRQVLVRDVPPPMDRVVQDNGVACVPESCAGVLLRERQRLEGGVWQSYCVRFQQVVVGLTSTALAEGVKAFDYDHDGDSDLLFLRRNEGPLLYQNNAGVFADVTLSAGLASALPSAGAAVGDYDGDGQSDLLLVGSRRNVLYHNDGAHFTEVTNVFSSADAILPSRAAAIISSIILIGTVNGTRAYQYESGHWNDVTATSGIEDREGEVYDIAVTRIDGAFHVYLANPTGRNRHFVEDPTSGHFNSVELTDGTVGRGSSVSAEWVRYQGESSPSLSIGTYSQGNYLFVRDSAADAGVDGGMNTYHDLSSTLGIHDPGPTSTVRWGNFAGDNRPWLFVGRQQNPALGRSYPNLLYVPTLEMPGNVVTRYVDIANGAGLATLSEPGSGITYMNVLGAQVLDYNRDGSPDIALAYNNIPQTQGAVGLFRNDSRWVRVCESSVRDAGVRD